MKTRVLLFIISLFYLCSCDRNEEDYPNYMTWPSTHFTNHYILPDSLLMDCVKDSLFDDFMLAVDIKGESVMSDDCRDCSQKKHPLFDSIANLYHDVSWTSYGTYQEYATAFPVEDISITSDADFDENHPTGTNLIAVAKIEVRSSGEFVLSNYPKGVECYEKLSKPFPEFTDAQKCLWEHSGFAIILPPTSLHQTITVTMKFQGGKTLSASAMVN